MKKKINKPLVVITGPTASGKTSLAIKIAQKFNGEIISADSRAIYQYADVGTAKPFKEEQELVPHWGIDIVEPGEYFSVADFKNYAMTKIDEIRSRNHIPILVGGTGLYIDSVIFDYKFGTKADNKLRSELQHKSLDELYEYCNKYNIILPENYKNKRYIIRAIENKGSNCLKSEKPLDNSIIVGITTEKSVLISQIKHRIEQLFDNGVVDEAKMLGEKYGWGSEAMKSNIYQIINLYLRKEISLDEAKEKSVTLDWRLSKRQMTWMRRNKFIHWLSLINAEKFIVEQLATSE